MVPPKAQATVLGLTAEQVNAAIAALGMEAAISYTVAPAEGGVCVQASGQNAHGSTPEEGHNAQTALLTLLAALLWAWPRAMIFPAVCPWPSPC